MGGTKDLFSPIRGKTLSPIFKYVMESPAQVTGRMMANLAFNEIHTDKNFKEQFQTSGFDQRTWELYLFAYFRMNGFKFDRRFDRPDFVLKKDGIELTVEAVTSGKTQIPSGKVPETSAKIHKALTSKLDKKYWELSHVAGRPFVIAFAPFHTDSPYRETDSILTEYLYGVHQSWHHDKSGRLVVNSVFSGKGFFDDPGTAQVSAVIYNNSGTFSKFNRMGYQEKPNDDVLLLRFGTCYNDDPISAKPNGFIYKVGSDGCVESWGQGMTVHHNPNAMFPLPQRLFGKDVTHNLRHEKELITIAAKNYIFSSMTRNYCAPQIGKIPFKHNGMGELQQMMAWIEKLLMHIDAACSGKPLR